MEHSRILPACPARTASPASTAGKKLTAGGTMASHLLLPGFTDVFYMKSKIHIVGFMLGLFAFAAATNGNAQGTLYVSSLGSTNPIFVGLGPNYWMAQPFVTGPTNSPYTLDSVQLMMLVTGTSSGTNLQVSLCSNNGGVPGSGLAPLTGSDPTSSGVCTYTASGVSLAPSTTYWILVTSGLMQNGFPVFLAGASQTTNYVSSAGWILGAPMYSTDLSSWQAAPYYAAQIAVRATVPEPSTAALIGMGFLTLVFWRRKLA